MITNAKVALNIKKKLQMIFQYYYQRFKMQEENHLSFEIPKDCYCPISYQIMKNPVMAVDLQTYQQQNIKEWLKNHNRSPLTNLRLSDKKLTPNIAVRKIIQTLQQNKAKIKQNIQAKNQSILKIKICFQRKLKRLERKKKAMQSTLARFISQNQSEQQQRFGKSQGSDGKYYKSKLIKKHRRKLCPVNQADANQKLSLKQNLRPTISAQANKPSTCIQQILSFYILGAGFWLTYKIIWGSIVGLSELIELGI